MKQFSFRFLSVSVCLALIVFNSCKKEVKPSEETSAIIKSVEVLNTEDENIVEITGHGFGKDASALDLSYAGRKIRINSVQENKIIGSFEGAPVKGSLVANINGDNLIEPLAAWYKTKVVAFAGDSTYGSADGPALSARFTGVTDMAFDGFGNLYVAESSKHRIRKIATDGNVTTIAGTGTAGYLNGAGLTAKFNYPTALTLDANGNIYVADRENHRIRKIAQDGTVSTYAGTGDPAFLNGAALTAKFNTPSGVAFDMVSNALYVSDKTNNRIRKISSGGIVTTFAGTGFGSNHDDVNSSATFWYPAYITTNGTGAFYQIDIVNINIKKISGGSTVTLAGNGWEGSTDGPGNMASFKFPGGLAVTSSGVVYVADTHNHRIRTINASNNVKTYSGSVSGYKNGLLADALFKYPSAVALSPTGVLYIGDETSIRKIVKTPILTF